MYSKDKTKSEYCNGFDQRVARQQLCKHGPTSTIEEAGFSVVPTDAPVDWLDRDHVIYVSCDACSF
jgi:tRNA(Arg) A34 adenosine deaminase TadA